MNDNYLIHHGIKGQKWGVRRYQNPDGTLTDAGRKRITRKEKKQVDKLYKELAEKGSGFGPAVLATAARQDKKDYKDFADTISSGEFYIQGHFEKNYKEKAVDYYVGNDKNPTVRAKYLDGKNFTYDFTDKYGETKYNEFASYYNNDYLKTNQRPKIGG